MKNTYTAVYKKTKKWCLGWIEEIPGVNSQGKTLKELRENLHEAVRLVVETNRLLTRVEVGRGDIIREGARHSVFFHPDTKRISTIPRHKEIDVFLGKKICHDLGIDEIKKS